MDIYKTTLRTLGSATQNDDLYTIAKNSAIPLGNGSVSTDGAIVYVNEKPDGMTQVIGTKIGGTSSPVKSVTPSYFPFATEGAECAALVTSLSWADNNLASGYEWLQLNVGASIKYFVSGVLTSSETEFNDPFAAAGFSVGCCWEGAYSVGINPF